MLYTPLACDGQKPNAGKAITIGADQPAIAGCY